MLKFKKVNSKSRGEMFGEVALIDRKGRNAHCIAMKPTECGVLNYPDYSQVFKKMQELEQKVKKNFFERVVLKDQNLWDQAKLLMSFFDKSKYIRGQTLFKKGDHCQKIWIIIEGQVVLWDLFPVSRSLAPGGEAIRKEKLKKRLDLLILRDGDSLGDELLLEPIVSGTIQTRTRYYATVEAESIIYECNLRLLRQHLETNTQDYMKKNWAQSKADARKLLLERAFSSAQHKLEVIMKEEQESNTRLRKFLEHTLANQDQDEVATREIGDKLKASRDIDTFMKKGYNLIRAKGRRSNKKRCRKNRRWGSASPRRKVSPTICTANSSILGMRNRPADSAVKITPRKASSKWSLLNERILISMLLCCMLFSRVRMRESEMKGNIS